MRTVGLTFEKKAKKTKPAKGKAEKPEAKAAEDQPAEDVDKPEAAEGNEG